MARTGLPALYSDVVLPAVSYYEKVDLNTTDCHTFIHPFGKAMEPLFESKTDWDIFHALAEKMAEVARKKGLQPFHDKQFEWSRDFTQLPHDWTSKGTINTDEQAANFILSTIRMNRPLTRYQLSKCGCSAPRANFTHNSLGVTERMMRPGCRPFLTLLPKPVSSRFRPRRKIVSLMPRPSWCP